MARATVWKHPTKIRSILSLFTLEIVNIILAKNSYKNNQKQDQYLQSNNFSFAKATVYNPVNKKVQRKI